MQSTAYSKYVCVPCVRYASAGYGKETVSVLELHADASAQCSTALQTVGGYAGNT